MIILDNQYQRVQKLISNAGLMSRRKAEEYIDQGRVKVNGKSVKLGDKALLTDKITVDGKQLFAEKRKYLIFNKPPDCLTTLDDPQGRKTIFSYIHEKERVIPVGRLDFKTEGLLLLTNDGDFANRVMHPRYEVNKTYHVWLSKPLNENDRLHLETGVILDDGKTSISKVDYLDSSRQHISIRIHEGRNRIVRRMLSALGYTTRRLVRMEIGKLSLGILPQGSCRDMTQKEKELVFK